MIEDISENLKEKGFLGKDLEIELKKYFNGLISHFYCKIDDDIEKFLKEKSLLFQNKNKARTYFIVDNDKLKKGEFDIFAYFVLSTKILYLPEELSKNQRKKIDGLYNSISEIPTFLIGQIGKNDENKENISGKEILKYACNFIEEASDIVAGRIILVELKNNQKLINFYINNGFSLLDNNTKNEEDLLQMIKIIV